MQLCRNCGSVGSSIREARKSFVAYRTIWRTSGFEGFRAARTDQTFLVALLIAVVPLPFP